MIQVKNCVSEHNYWILIIISHSAEESYFNKNQKKPKKNQFFISNNVPTVCPADNSDIIYRIYAS